MQNILLDVKEIKCHNFKEYNRIPKTYSKYYCSYIVYKYRYLLIYARGTLEETKCKSNNIQSYPTYKWFMIEIFQDMSWEMSLIVGQDTKKYSPLVRSEWKKN